MGNWKNFLFAFHGRIGRAALWLYVAIATPLFLLLAGAFWVYALSIPGAYENGGPTPFPGDLLGIAGAILFFLLLAAAVLAGTAVMVKRLHDRDKAWWWIVIFILAPDALTGLAQYLTQSEALNESAIFAVQFAAVALTVWGFVELALLRGTAGVNRFGPDPLAAR